MKQHIRHTASLLPIALFVSLAVTVAACGKQDEAVTKHTVIDERIPMESAGSLDTATFGAGCFWCVEAVFQQLEGVRSVVSGYAGGTVANPTYQAVCTGSTGHAEVCEIIYDPTVIGFADLLQAFFMSHDPTTLNRQGNDAGTQYRSAIFYHSDEQRALAEKYKEELDRSGTFKDPIVTEIVPFDVFYKAENYHQNYYNENGSQPYCQYVIRPKLDKFTKEFKDKLKKK